MAPSQLKRLKASLRESGVVGPQKSKKQKKQASKNGVSRDSRVQRNVALQGIREQFKPFDIQAPARPKKFEVTDNNTVGGRIAKNIIGRPGVTKGLGEENVGQINPKDIPCADTEIHSDGKPFLLKCSGAKKLVVSWTEGLERTTLQ